MSNKKWSRLVALVVATTAVIAVAQPAYALSNVPDATWGAKGKVYALARNGDTMYVGGNITKAFGPGGQSAVIAGVMAVTVSTGTYLPSFTTTVASNAGVAEVDALAVSPDGSTLFLGGKFDTVNGVPRQNFAAVDTATGTQVNPLFTATPNQKVDKLLVNASLVYMGGNFLKVNAISRPHLAAVSAIDGSLSSAWHPAATAGANPCPSQFPAGTSCGPVTDGGTGQIHSMVFAPDGNSVFVGGNFFYIDGVPRNTIAQVDAVNGALLPFRVPWNTLPGESESNPYDGPNVSWVILPTASRIYVGWGRTPNGFSAFNTTTTTTASGECSNLPTIGSGCNNRIWNQGTPGNAESLALSPDGTRLFVGGHFGTGDLDYRLSSCAGTVYAHGLVSVNPATGAIFCDWVPQPTPFGGTSAPGSHVTGPNFVGTWAMVMTENALFTGGWFTAFSGVAQSGVAKFTLVGGPPPPPPPPTITTYTPTTGPVGTPVTITGTGFTGATDVAFGTVSASSFTVDSDTQITVIVPSGFDKAIIKVTTLGGSAKSTGLNFKVVPAVIQSMTPTTGDVGVQVTLTGAGFTDASAVRFNGLSATFTVDSNTQITTTVPLGASTGFVSVVTASNGTLQSPTQFTVTSPPPPVPSITTFTPTTGPVGTEVVITGTGFTNASNVSFGTVSASTFTVDSDTQITVIVPAGFDKAIIKVTTPGGTAKSTGQNFRVT